MGDGWEIYLRKPSPHHRQLPDMRGVIAEMWRAGATQTEIAVAIGRPKSSINTEIRRMRANGCDLPYRDGRKLNLNLFGGAEESNDG